MGNGASVPAGGARVSKNPFTRARYARHHGSKAALQRPGILTRRKCQAKPRYVDSRGFALQEIYEIQGRQLDKYPPGVYSLEQAEQDIAACAAGKDLPHYRRVVRYDVIAGDKDPRVYALMKYHRYTAAELADGTVLKILPYSEKDAQIDITTFQKTGKPYYKVVKAISQVIDEKKKIVRDWRDKGFDNKYKYQAYDPRAEKARVAALGGPVRRKFDATKYPKKKVGGRWVRIVPCTEFPSMCAKGDQTFTFLASNEKSDAFGSAMDAKAAKAAAQRQAIRHSQEQQALRRRIAAAKGKNAGGTKAQVLNAQRRLAKMESRLRAIKGCTTTKCIKERQDLGRKEAALAAILKTMRNAARERANPPPARAATPAQSRK